MERQLIEVNDAKKDVKHYIELPDIGYFEESSDKSTKILCRSGTLVFVKESVKEVQNLINGALSAKSGSVI